jgi:hypothetical protein
MTGGDIKDSFFLEDFYHASYAPIDPKELKESYLAHIPQLEFSYNRQNNSFTISAGNKSRFSFVTVMSLKVLRML